jgi:phosphoglycolate phosphatase
VDSGAAKEAKALNAFPALLLFDLDGTLLTTGGAGMRAMRQAVERLYGRQFNWDGIETAGRLDPLIFADAAQRNGFDDAAQRHDLFHDAYAQGLAGELADENCDVRVMPGVHGLLDMLRHRAATESDVLLGMLTGNYADTAALKLAAADIDPQWFTLTAFGDEGPNRPALVRLAMDRYEQRFSAAVDPRRVIVIGDTPHDVSCAHAHGCVAFAVATGRHSVEQLDAAGADHVVADLSDPQPLLAAI